MVVEIVVPSEGSTEEIVFASACFLNGSDTPSPQAVILILRSLKETPDPRL